MQMSTASAGCTSNSKQDKYKGVRRRKWGKWVSEIRLPGTKTRLWLGSYSTPQAAAVAHDTAVYCVRGPSSIPSLNFPTCVPMFLRSDMSPRSIQRAASDAGTAIDAQLVAKLPENEMKPLGGAVLQVPEALIWEEMENGTAVDCVTGEMTNEGETLSISVDDMEICI